MKPCFIILACLVALLRAPLVARAQEGSRHARSELESTRRDALASIEAGTRTGGELAPLYLALARSAALLGDEEQARRAFTVLLALEPGFRLDREEPDEVRSPYLEARGFWSARPSPLGVDLTLSADARGVAMHVTDPGKLSARVRVRVRLEGATEFMEMVRMPESDLTVPVDGLERAAGLDVNVALLDEYGNRLLERGSDTLPEHLVAARVEAESHGKAGRRRTRASTEPELALRRRRFHLGAAVSLAVGAGALTWAVVAHLQREQLAQRWNRGDCEGSGTTRASVCASERSDLERQQTTAAVLYGLGGAALAAGLVLLATAPARSVERPRARALACARGPGLVGVACALRF